MWKAIFWIWINHTTAYDWFLVMLHEIKGNQKEFTYASDVSWTIQIDNICVVKSKHWKIKIHFHRSGHVTSIKMWFNAQKTTGLHCLMKWNRGSPSSGTHSGNTGIPYIVKEKNRIFCKWQN
jgi:hypothetical protein